MHDPADWRRGGDFIWTGQRYPEFASDAKGDQ
jgi:hypothetical protein